MDTRPDLELDASQALFAARMLVQAVHDEGPWSFRWGMVEVPAERSLGEDGVTFTGHFPDICYLDPPRDGLVLLCRGEVVGIRPMRDDHPGDTGFTVAWSVIAERKRVAP